MKHAKDMHALYINDFSEDEVVVMEKHLTSDPVIQIFPLNYICH